MNKIIFLGIAFLIANIAFAQQNKKVKIVSSELLKGFTDEGFMRIIKPVFNHEESTLTADSANFSQDKNNFDAFGHVVITQTDGTTIYADILNFDGNSKMALLTNNVRLVDKDATLSTNYLTYNTGTKIGTYTTGGTIVDPKNVLTSVTGYYFATTRDAYFKNNVVVTSTDAIIKSDTLRYNTQSKIAYFYGPTHIYGKSDTLYTENGDYNTISEQARFGKNNLYTQGPKSLKGDSLFFDRKLGYGRAIKNITFIDAAQKLTFKGDLGIYHKKDESILATQNAYIILHTESDTSKVDSLWMTADTLFSKVVKSRDIKSLSIYKKKTKQLQNISLDKSNSNKNLNKKIESTLDSTKRHTPITDSHLPQFIPQSKSVSNSIELTTSDKITLKADSQTFQNNKLPAIPITLAKSKAPPDPAALKLSQDSLKGDTAKVRIVLAYHKAKIFKADLQAKADSIFFTYKDSLIRCYISPMMWTQGSQFSADTMYLQMKNKKLDHMLLRQNGFIVNIQAIDSSKFNQVKGKTITGYFKNNKLNDMFVDGNSESIYYVKEGTRYTGMNKMISSQIKVFFEKNELKNILFIGKPDGNYYPIQIVPSNNHTLPGFLWKPQDRPKSKEEIIPTLGKPQPDTPIEKLNKPIPENPEKSSTKDKR